MSNVFGPFYPSRLQAVVNRAERFADRVASDHGATTEAATIWLEGRAEEIAAYVSAIVNDWRFEDLGESEAASRMASYLESLRVGYRHHFGPRVQRRRADAATRVGDRAIDWNATEIARTIVPPGGTPSPNDTPESPISPR
jgi:hypothetical protein